jgi:hypothetical protein
VNKLLLATVGDVSMPGGSLLADPCTIPTLLAGLNAKVLAGLVLALTGLTVMGAMFFVRKWLWRYLGVHATDRLQRLGSAGLLVAVLGVSSAIFGARLAGSTSKSRSPGCGLRRQPQRPRLARSPCWRSPT